MSRVTLLCVIFMLRDMIYRSVAIFLFKTHIFNSTKYRRILNSERVLDWDYKGTLLYSVWHETKNAPLIHIVCVMLVLCDMSHRCVTAHKQKYVFYRFELYRIHFEFKWCKILSHQSNFSVHISSPKSFKYCWCCGCLKV